MSEDLQNISGEIADLTKTASNPNGVSLFTDASGETYKSTYQILKDISAIYHDLTDKQQAELLEKLAGKRGGQVLAGLLDDFSEVERAMGEIEGSAGSADAEMEIVKDSIEYKLNELKETWVGVWQDILTRDDLKLITSGLIGLSDVLGGVISTLGAIPSIGAGAGLFFGIKNLGRRRELLPLPLKNCVLICRDLCMFLWVTTVKDIDGNEIHYCKVDNMVL